MKPLNLKYQGGVALIIFVLGLMGIGGFLLVGYSQGILKQVEVSKTQHNTRVLNEAKQALLQFAYNYPVLSTPSIGPGRLPNADTDNDGIADGGSTFGRLPWAQANLNLYDIRDADGERLWYAVSSTFRPQAAIVNSDTSGNLTLRDQQGNVIYDGSNPGGLAQYGIAAVIIAPGAVTARNGAAQDRSIANENNPVHYLDLVFGTEDNATRTLGSPTDGFILGPVDTLSTDAVNDQFIVITAAEVIEVAEKATLQAYRKAISDYLALIGGVYPWLYNYAGVPDIAGLSSYYPANSNFATELATNLDNFGRIPSIFNAYFIDTDSQPIESKLSVALSLTYPITPTPVGYNQLIPCCPIGNFLFNNAASHALNIQTADKLTNLRFVDIAGNDGQLTGTVTTPELFTHEIYFWDEDHGTTGIWTLCPAGADDPSDCDRDSAGNPTPGAGNQKDAELLHVVLELDFNGVVNFDTDYTNPPVIAPPVAATGTSHASITGTFLGADIILGSLPLSARYEIDRHYHTTFDIQESGTLDLVDLTPGPLTLGMRYYPELPDWVFDNGWHNSLMMAYAANYRPDILGTCTAGTDCIQINNFAGNNDNKVSILTLAGQHNWDDDLDSNFINDLPTIFDAENADVLDIDGTEYLFDRREFGGNDKILVIDEL